MLTRSSREQRGGEDERCVPREGHKEVMGQTRGLALALLLPLPRRRDSRRQGKMQYHRVTSRLLEGIIRYRHE